MKAHHLYRHFDAQGRLLYVGISLSAMQRLRDHQGSSHWFNSITHVTIEEFPSRNSVLAAEKKAIRRENPVWNKQGRNWRAMGVHWKKRQVAPPSDPTVAYLKVKNAALVAELNALRASLIPPSSTEERVAVAAEMSERYEAKMARAKSFTAPLQ